MPISAENAKLYPENWKDIRKSILERAKNCCEFCALPNYSIGYRNEIGQFIHHSPEDSASGHKIIRIILTIAHIVDPDPANCNPENLRALCQKCHNTLDARSRAVRAAETRRAKKLGL